nr:hypothetical protein [Tanacetum cinerariifolium]
GAGWRRCRCGRRPVGAAVAQPPGPDHHGPADDPAGHPADDDQLYPDRDRARGAPPGARPPADPAQPGADRAGAVPVAVRDGADHQPDEHPGDSALCRRPDRRHPDDP